MSSTGSRYGRCRGLANVCEGQRSDIAEAPHTLLRSAVLTGAQDRLNKCITVCHDSFQDDARRVQGDERAIESLKRAFNGCAASCGERQLPAIDRLRDISGP